VSFVLHYFVFLAVPSSLLLFYEIDCVLPLVVVE